MNEKVYHRTCFKCVECKAQLTASSAVVSVVDGKTLYCLTHWKTRTKAAGGFEFAPEANKLAP